MKAAAAVAAAADHCACRGTSRLACGWWFGGFTHGVGCRLLSGLEGCCAAPRSQPFTADLVCVEACLCESRPSAVRCQVHIPWCVVRQCLPWVDCTEAWCISCVGCCLMSVVQGSICPVCLRWLTYSWSGHSTDPVSCHTAFTAFVGQ